MENLVKMEDKHQEPLETVVVIVVMLTGLDQTVKLPVNVLVRP